MARSNKAKSRKASQSMANRHPQLGAKQNHLSMQQEARNTEGRRLWRTDTHLRHRSVVFVSAGSIKPAREFEKRSAAADHNQSQMVELPNEAARHTQHEIIDITTDLETQSTELLGPTLRRRSCTPDNSSEDEIVFQGRRTKIEPSNNPHIQGAATEAYFELDIQPELAPCAHERDALVEASSTTSTASSRKETLDFVRINHYALNTTPPMSDEDEILADYIANIDDDESSLSPSEGEDVNPQEEPEAVATKRGADDILLDTDSDSESDGHEFSADSEFEGLADFVSFARSKSSREKSTYVPASAFADSLELDPYYGFDIMNFKRASLGKKTRKGREHPNLDSIDVELGADSLDAWNNDRLKKKSKKKEREQLRALGLLGRRKNNPELKIKYADGIGFEDLKSEIRLFLQSSKHSLSLPPMTKHRRILVHDMAHALRLTSKSRGKGSSRFPVLSKTSRTPTYSPKTIVHIDRVLSREKFSPRALKAWGKSDGRPTKAKAGHGNVSYMDGDVVGASAPEIGAENIGRAMLEKMGWSRGTALGAIHNKGILLPVSHVVKNSKAGLG
ncbi:hypothetical protein BJX64DRAFT_101044 [Aspergillus heterothallicus]